MRARSRRLVVSTSALAFGATLLGGAGAARAVEGVPDTELKMGAIPDSERQALEAAFIGEEPLIAATVYVPADSSDALTRTRTLATRYNDAPSEAFLATAAFRAGSFDEAEKAWKAAVADSGNAIWALSALADFYDQRLRPTDELSALSALAQAQNAALLDACHARNPLSAATTPAECGEDLDTDLRAALDATFTRALSVIADHALPPSQADPAADPTTWRAAQVSIHPDDISYLSRWVEQLIAAGDTTGAQKQLDAFHSEFASDPRTLTRLAAEIQVALHHPDAALDLYRSQIAAATASTDLSGLYTDYFGLLGTLKQLDAEAQRLTAARQAGTLSEADLVALCYLDLTREAQSDARALLDQARIKQPPSSDLATLQRARLHDAVGDTPQAERYFYAAYQAGQTTDLKVRALLELSGTLLGGDATRTVFTPIDPFDGFALDRVDTGPSILGGLASLAFQGSEKVTGSSLAASAAAYQNGLEVEALLARAQTLAPNNGDVGSMLVSLQDYYQSFKRWDAVVAVGKKYLAGWPAGPHELDVALANADALRHAGDRAASDGAYEDAISRAEHRSRSDFYRALNAYAGVLEGEHSVDAVVALYWQEIQRRPGDPDLYEGLASFVESYSNTAAQLKIYTAALKQFGGMGWQDRLARWQLRNGGVQAFTDYTRGIVSSLPGSDVEAYLQSMPGVYEFPTQADVCDFESTFYKMALARFPYQVSLAEALLAHYDRCRPTFGEDPAVEPLLERYAVLDSGMRARLISTLGSQTALDSTLKTLAAPRGRGQTLVKADLLVWLSQQEAATPLYVQLASAWPSNVETQQRLAKLTIDLAPPADAAAAEKAAAIYDTLAKYYPADATWPDASATALAEAGELDAAKTRWQTLVTQRPGVSDAYAQVAAALWDYYLYDDAATAIVAARAQAKDPLLYWDKMGAIWEGKQDLAKAADEYARAYVEVLGPAISAPTASWTVGEGEQPPTDEGEGDDDDDGGGYDGEGSGSAPAHLAETTPSERVAGFSQRHGGKTAMKAAFNGLIKASPTDYKPALAYTRWLGQVGKDSERKKELKKAIAAYDDSDFLATAATDAQSAGFGGVAVDALRRRSLKGGQTPALVYALCNMLEANGRQSEADAEYTGLIGRLKAAGPGATEDLIGSYQTYASYLVRHHRAEDAIAAEQAALALSTGDEHDRLAYTLAQQLLAAGHFTDAGVLMGQLFSKNPRDVSYLEGVADAAAGAATPATVETVVGAVYQAALATAQKQGASFDSSTQHDWIVTIRMAYITRLEQLGDHAAAVDQWIEIVKRDDATLQHLPAAIDYARRHGQVDRLQAFFKKAESDSPRDVRWPLLLASMDMAAGQPADAVSEYQKALALSPENQTYYQEGALAALAAGDAATAETLYAKLYDLSDQDPEWLLPLANAYASQREDDEVRQTLKTYIDKETDEGPGRYTEAATVLTTAGLDDDALHMYGLAVEEMKQSRFWSGSDMASLVGPMLDAAARAGKIKETIADIRTDGGDACDSALGSAVIRLLGTEALDADSADLEKAMDDLVDRDVPRSGTYGGTDTPRWVDEARAAGLIPLATKMALRIPDAGVRDSALMGLFTDRDRDLIAFVDAPGATAYQTDAWLSAAALAANRLGDEDAELALLGRDWSSLSAVEVHGPEDEFNYNSPQVARYLELLEKTGDHATLQSVADRGHVAAGQVINWLFEHGETDLGLRAIDAAQVGLGLPPIWGVAGKALALAVTGDRSDRTQGLFEQALGRKTIGDATDKPPAQGTALFDDSWYRVAVVYANLFSKAGTSPRIRLADYALAPAEQQPLAASGQLAVGALYLARGEYASAEPHYQLALALDATNWNALDGIARCKLAQNDKAGALVVWNRIRAQDTDDAVIFYAQALNKAGLANEAQLALRSRLDDRYRKLDATTGPPLVKAFVGLYAPTDLGADGPADQALQDLLARAPRDWFLRTVLAAGLQYVQPMDDDFLNNPPLLHADALQPYYLAAIALGTSTPTTGFQDQAPVGYVRWLLTQGRLDDANAELADLASQATSTQGAVPSWIVLAQAEVAALGGDTDKAQQLITPLLMSGWDGASELSAAQDMLRRVGCPTCADTLAVQYYQKDYPDTLGTEQYLAIAGAQHDLGDQDGVVRALDEMIAQAPGDPGILSQAAAFLEKSGGAAAAVGYRQRLANLHPFDEANALALASDQLAAGNTHDALAGAVALLGERRADRPTRQGAADLIDAVLVDDKSLVGAAGTQVDARATSTPFDEATVVAQASVARRSGDAAHATSLLQGALGRFVLGAQANLALARLQAEAGQNDLAEKSLEQSIAVAGGPWSERWSLFDLRRGLGNNQGALGAIDQGPLGSYLGAGPDHSGYSYRKEAADSGAATFSAIAPAEIEAAATLAEADGRFVEAAFYVEVGARVSGASGADWDTQVRRATALLDQARVQALKDQTVYLTFTEEN
jgi:Flp pilus assembly protein TadD